MYKKKQIIKILYEKNDNWQIKLKITYKIDTIYEENGLNLILI